MSNYSADMIPKKRLLSLQLDAAKFERASDAEKEQHDVMRESTTFFKDGMRKLFKNPLAVISVVVLLLIIVTIALLAYVKTISKEGKHG